MLKSFPPFPQHSILCLTGFVKGGSPPAAGKMQSGFARYKVKNGLEVFRFFPDGGGSGAANLEFRCGELARIFRISKLTGRLSSLDKAEYEREQMQ